MYFGLLHSIFLISKFEVIQKSFHKELTAPNNTLNI